MDHVTERVLQSAVVKSNASNAIRCGSLITNARDFYDHCQENLVKDTSTTDGECLHFRRSFYYIENVSQKRQRTNIKSIKGTRSLQSVMAANDSGHINTRNLSCFCNACRGGSLEEFVKVMPIPVSALLGDFETDSKSDTSEYTTYCHGLE